MRRTTKRQQNSQSPSGAAKTRSRPSKTRLRFYRSAISLSRPQKQVIFLSLDIFMVAAALGLALMLHAMGEDDVLWQMLLKKFDTDQVGSADTSRNPRDSIPLDAFDDA